MSPPRSPCPPLPGVPGVSALMSADHQEGVEHNPEIAPLQTEFEALQAEFEQPKRDFEAKLDSSFSKLPPKNARASRPDRSARGTRGGCRTAGRHPRRHAKSNLFAARRRPVRVPRDRRRSPSRPARRARSTHRAWPRSRAQYFEPATRAEVGAMLTADPDTLTAHDIASGATWADRYRDSDRGGSRQRYEQTRQWHFVNIELDGPNLDRACFGHPRLPAAVPASSGPAKACLLTRSSNSQPSLAIRQRLRESGFSRWSSFCISSATCTSRFMPSTTTTRVATGSRVVATGFGAGNLMRIERRQYPQSAIDGEANGNPTEIDNKGECHSVCDTQSKSRQRVRACREFR